jgi:hypothetical protein
MTYVSNDTYYQKYNIELYYNEGLIMRIADLQINIVENGFVVHEQNMAHAAIGKTWAFESSKALSDFVRAWGDGNTKVASKPYNGIKPDKSEKHR